MTVHGQKLSLYIILLGLTLTACGGGEESRVQPRIIGPNGVITTTDDTSLEALKKQDTDKDGVSDYEEIFGYSLKINGVDTTVYSNPEMPDTDGDGRNDGDERSSKKIDGIDAELSTGVSTHPARRDFIVRVHAKGGTDGTEGPTVQPGTNCGDTGWNSFSRLQIRDDDTLVEIFDIQISKWTLGTGLQDLSAWGHDTIKFRDDGNSNTLAANECPAVWSPGANANVFKECRNEEEKGTLMAKFGAELNNVCAGSGSVSVGNTMRNQQSYLFSASTESGSGFAGRASDYLLLRANDRNNSLADNTGFLTIVVRMANAKDYSQATPSNADITRWKEKLIK